MEPDWSTAKMTLHSWKRFSFPQKYTRSGTMREAAAS